MVFKLVIFKRRNQEQTNSIFPGLVKVDDGSAAGSDKPSFSNKYKRLIHYATKEVDENKVDFPPGDKLGAAGMDRGFFSHLKKNWTRVMTSSSAVQLKRSVFSLM